MVSMLRKTTLTWSAGLLALAVPGAMTAQPAAAQADKMPATPTFVTPGLEAAIEKARVEWGVPGVAVVIVKDDKIIYAKGFGVRELGKPAQVDADTIFAIGSSSKAFTAAALAMLVDEKKVAWDGIVHDYMPVFELSDPYLTNHVTIRDLLAHRTGYVSGSGWLWTGSGFDRNEILRRLRFQTNMSGFRDRFLYANEMFIAAGEVIPAVTGTSWDDFTAKRIFAPLGMTRSYTSVAPLAGLQNVATPHGVVDGKLVAFPYRNVDNVGSAGSINASARDLAQWVRMQLGEGKYAGKQLISKASIDVMHAGQMVQRARNADGQFNEYGLGWMVHDYRGRKLVEHGGAVDGMRAGVAMMPEENLGVVVLTNRLPTQLVTAIQMQIYDAYLGGPATDWSAKYKAEEDKAKAAQEARRAAQAAPKSPATLPLASYTGNYNSKLYGPIKVALENGALTLARPTASAVLNHDRANLFKARWRSASLLSVFGETQIGFTIGADGAVTGLQMGSDAFEREK
jgi:CubicO group peptidase (beta-lactamase class C family)